MESPYSRPVAANLIAAAIERHRNRPADFCGYSLEMSIYTELRHAGYLTEEAQQPENKTPDQLDHKNLCCGRQSIWDPCENRGIKYG